MKKVTHTKLVLSLLRKKQLRFPDLIENEIAGLPSVNACECTGSFERLSKVKLPAKEAL